MDMNVYTYEDLENRGKPYCDLMESLQYKRLVPVLGSGFSKGLPSKIGKVPDVDELKCKLANLLGEYGGYSKEVVAEMQTQELSTISNFFMEFIKSQETVRREEMKKSFLVYMESFYSGIHNIPACQREFIKCDWPYLYTLNYDDTIESLYNNHEIEVVVPYQPLNKKWLQEKQCIIKLHGDVHALLQTGDLKYCVLSKMQYFQTIGDKVNHDLMEWLQDDYTSKDLLFIGCRLNEEYDFLFAESGQASRLAENSHTSYYIYFDETPDKDISLSLIMQLQIYGIKNIIRITDDQFSKFYCLIKKMSKEASSIASLDKLEKYSNYTFSTLSDNNDESNIDYLFENNNLAINSENHGIVFPSFFFQRDVEKKILTYLEDGTSICILSGNRFSGKTYILLDLMKSLQKKRKKAYLISGIQLSEKTVSRIKAKKNCIFIFDTGTVTNHQLQCFYDQVAEMKKQNLQIIYALNRSDRNFIKVLGDNAIPDKRDIRFSSVGTKLSDSELYNFNEGMKNLGLIERKKSESFLDYAIRLDEASFKMHSNILPETNILTQDNPEMVTCLIVLAAHPTFNNDVANMLDIRDELTDLCKNSERAVQKDYVSDIEISWDTHSGVKFVSNSTYWLYRCLSNFAKIPSSYEVISQAVQQIIKQYIKKYTRPDGSLEFKIYSEIQPYYYLESLQKMFFCDAPSKGSLLLPEMIYSNLKSLLGNDYQFLHQTAKCKLRLSRRNKDQLEQLKILNQAKRIIDRAYEIAQKSKGANILYTLAHMNVTKTLILTNGLRYCALAPDVKNIQLHTAIECYYYIYIEKADFVGDINYDLESDELSDIKWFITSLLTPDNSLYELLNNRDDRKKAEEIFNAYFQGKIAFD